MSRRLTHHIGWRQESGNIKHGGGFSVAKNNKSRVLNNLLFAGEWAVGSPAEVYQGVPQKLGLESYPSGGTVSEFSSFCFWCSLRLVVLSWR
jgi:hypothetical protein